MVFTQHFLRILKIFSLVTKVTDYVIFEWSLINKVIQKFSILEKYKHKSYLVELIQCHSDLFLICHESMQFAQKTIIDSANVALLVRVSKKAVDKKRTKLE